MTGFYISGTNHPVTYCGDGRLQIGCKNYTIAEWKTMYEKIGKSEGYTDSSIKEYFNYILMAEMFHSAQL